ncbi:MAG TPA: DNA mismatch repair protein MutS [Planctomycetes bacterium]|nr:DNA mismatch repair protein MutS [Planctomycetota bacterium]
MMAQFWRAKKEAPDALLFFRMGDFYELFHQDAVTASRELGLTLTARSKGDDAIPMAGVPVKAAEGYLIRLVKKGHKVAICEQLQDPRHVKGIVDRGIVRLVTPGTLTEESALDARTPNFLASLFTGKKRAGLGWVDLSTGRFLVSEFPPHQLADELARVQPAELLVPEGLGEDEASWIRNLCASLEILVTEREPWRFDRDSALRTLREHFGVAGLGGFGIEEDSIVVPSAGALLEYVAETQKAACAHILRISRVSPEDHLVLDRATRTCLELVSTQREGRREGTLLEAIDRTETPMGSRLLREWLLAPLRRVEPIRARQQGVSAFVDAPFLRDEVRSVLDEIVDVERLAGRIATGRSNGRDLASLAASMALVPSLRTKLEGTNSVLLADLRLRLDPLEDITSRIQRTLVDAPPLTIKEGGLVRDGFSAELDELRQIAGDAKSWMARFQAEEAERSGISGLKIGFNSVFGYFLEVPRGQVSRVPEHYVRKQTIKTAERYITPELKEFETKVLKSEELARDLEYDIFVALRDEVAGELRRVLDTARAIAELDCLSGLAQVAAENRYVAPVIDEGTELSFREGRHPVIERSPSCETFVPNDGHFDNDANRITILTGPNMAGKSTYIRQTALIALLAQIGSFVPAEEAHVGVVDRIFTRIGAGDDISRGESTFMVEMVEIANILNNATERSLVVLDEVGRGTSTFDGLALAWSIAEHLHENVGCRTLFATHYHQLTDLSTRFPGVVNRNVAVREWGDEIVFLHKIVPGGTDRSYGIQVARLAGVPKEVLERAKTILRDLEHDEEDLAERILAGSPAPETSPGAMQLDLFAAAPSEVERRLRETDLDRLTPIDALLLLRELKEATQPG